ncbi:MAG: NnrS family protein [Alphaproteobacteria bacterium]|nr:MAG: NnrS family protein [Alphaproteobacteria bacterium]
MSAQDRTPVPRYRPFAGPALFAHGFRPFFLLAGMWAPLALIVFLAALQGLVALPSRFDPVAWHHHEMLHGFVAAAIAGFSLTAIPNWTGRLPLQGVPLMALVGAWLAGRVAVACSALVGAWLAAALDLAFLTILVAFILREIVAGRNWRNLPIVLAIALLLLANAVAHGEIMGLVSSHGLSQRLAVGIVVTLITLIGGRIIPSFTRNWLVKRGATALPKPFGTFDRAAILATVLACGLWAAKPSGVAAGLLAAAAVLNGLRLARWRGPATGREPLLWVLHLGYAWIPLGLALLAASHWWPAIPATGALHALTAGAMGTMVLAVMSRATLGHTGRPLVAGAGLRAAYILVTLAALARLTAALAPAHYSLLLDAAALAWVLAFVAYLAVCGPMLVARRAADKEMGRAD